MRSIFFLICCCWMPLALAQKENIRPINQVFSYQESRPYSGLLYIHGNSQPVKVQQVGPAYRGYIWIRKDNNWRIIDSLRHCVSDSTLIISNLVPCANGKNTWAHTSKGWVLHNYRGEKLTEAFEYLKEINKDWYVLYQNDRWLFGNQEGRIGQKRFVSYRLLNPDKNMMLVNEGVYQWQFYDCASDELSKEKYADFFSHKEFVLVKKDDGKWACIKAEKLDSPKIPIEGQPWTAGDTASGFFIRDKTDWKLFAYTQPRQMIGSYDSVVFNQINQTSFALRNNQWKLVSPNQEENICLKKNELSYLITPSGPYTIAYYQQAKVANYVQQDFYRQGLDPEKFALFEISRPSPWYGDPNIFLFKANGKTGLCNMENNQVTTLPWYSGIDVLAAGYYRATYKLSESGYGNDAIGIIKRNAEILIPFHYSAIDEMWNTRGTGRMFVCEMAWQVYDFYDEQGKKMNDQPVASATAIYNAKLNKSCGRYELLVEGGNQKPSTLYTFNWNENTRRYTMEIITDQEKIKTAASAFNAQHP